MTLVLFCSLSARCLLTDETGRSLWEAGLSSLQHLHGELLSMTSIVFATALVALVVRVCCVAFSGAVTEEAIVTAGLIPPRRSRESGSQAIDVKLWQGRRR